MYYWNWPWSTSCTVTLVVAALGCLPHLPFGAIGILGPHDAECTLELHMQPHWLVLVLPLEDGLVVENIAQVWFGMLMFALPSWGYHAVLRLILTGSLTRLLEYCDGFCGWFCSWWPPHILLFFEGGFAMIMLRFVIHSYHLVSPSLVWIIFMVHLGARIEFAVLVGFVFLRCILARIFRACFRFFCSRG